MTARISGTNAATAAPNAMSRITNVSGIVIRSELSRSSFTSVEMSSFASVLFRPWMRQVGVGGTQLVEERRNRREPFADVDPFVRERGDHADRRPVGRDETGLGRRAERIDDLVEGRDGRAADSRGERLVVRATTSATAAAPSRPSTVPDAT